MSQSILETKGLSKKYGAFTALKPLDLQLEKGCIYGLIGKNGAGKTTLLKMLAGQALPTSGEINLFGKKGKALNSARKRMGAIVEHPAFFPDLTGRQNLEYYRIQRGIVEKNSVAVALRDMGLLDIADKKMKSYSLGNIQRLGIALALLGNPDLLILDEPINGFDPMGVIEIRQLLLELNQKRHITILLSSHNLFELEMLITKVGFLDKGVLIEELSMKDLRKKCQSIIEVKVNHSEKAIAVLEGKLGISDVGVLPEHTIQIQGKKELIPQISKILNENAIEIYSLREVAVSLEAYFIQLIGGN